MYFKLDFKYIVMFLSFSMVAIELAKIHGNLPLETDPRADPFNPTGVVFSHVPETLKDPEKQSKSVIVLFLKMLLAMVANTAVQSSTRPLFTMLFCS